jgi:hypothetical protein
MEFFNVVVWFSSFVTLTAFLGQLFFCQGTVCAAAQANVVFASVLFALWGVSLFAQARDIFRAGFRRRSVPGSPTSMKEPLA